VDNPFSLPEPFRWDRDGELDCHREPYSGVIWFAEFETNPRRERQLEGIAKAKAAGVYGRPPGIDRGLTTQQIAAKL
jgi:hypothetical protein